MIRQTFAVRALLFLTLAALGPVRAFGADGPSPQAFVEDFLLRLGDHKFDTLDADFAPKATVVVIRQRDGQWTNVHQTAEEWLATLKKNPNPVTFREPIQNVKVTVDSERLAYVRADFTVVRDGKTLSSGVDQFTLVRDGDRWKIAMVAYTSIPAQ